MLRSPCLLSAVVAFCALTILPARAQPADEILFRFSGAGLFDGEFGSLHQVQVSAQAALKRCGSKENISTNGRMDAQAQKAFKALAACPGFNDHLGSESEARRGAVTVQLWNVLLGTQPPAAADRARTIMLTFEATDYTDLEWNFCQSRPLYNPPQQPVCFSNDPHSFITWGPNGATAGGGREVQAILNAIEVADQTLVSKSFGGSSDEVRRLLHIQKTAEPDNIGLFLCGLWVKPEKRAAWKAGFRSLGSDSTVRDIYDRVYRSKTFDGGKIDAFASAYSENGLTPSEIDFAFFKDRAAHMSISKVDVSRAIRSVVSPNDDHAKVRRAVAQQVRPSNQAQDRLGRDVAFYVDAVGVAELTAEEATAWAKRGRRRASDVGLSDARQSNLAKSEPAIDTSVTSRSELTVSERAACPAAVIHTHPPSR